MELDRCAVAKRAIRMVFLTWGQAWMKLDPETRRAYLALEIVALMSGQCHPEEWDKQDGKGFTAYDCQETIKTCEYWASDGGKLGHRLIRMADLNKDDPDDPIPVLAEKLHYLYG